MHILSVGGQCATLLLGETICCLCYYELKGLFPPARQLQQTTEFETRTLLYVDLPLATFAQVISYH